MRVDSTSIDLILEGRRRDVGGLDVRRVLPAMERRLVGPFIFFDHLGPVDLPPGRGIDVAPHPHINLATVTYLFDGEIFHRDSLGSAQAIVPGDVNWMTAGRGIVHSERSAKEARQKGGRLHAIQLWVALPLAHEEDAPSFAHHPKSAIPRVRREGAELAVILGSAYGERSPVELLSPTFYVEARLEAGAELDLPEHDARAAYVVDGEIDAAGQACGPGKMAVWKKGAPARVQASRAARVMLLGGAALDGPRHIDWNFVSSTKERIERAKLDWREGRFPKVPGDEHDFIPLPER